MSVSRTPGFGGINEITLAMVVGICPCTLARIVCAYPTPAEAIRKALDAYDRSRPAPTIQSPRRAGWPGDALPPTQRQ